MPRTSTTSFSERLASIGLPSSEQKLVSANKVTRAIAACFVIVSILTVAHLVLVNKAPEISNIACFF